jgi:signal transduction histidine kinase
MAYPPLAGAALYTAFERNTMTQQRLVEDLLDVSRVVLGEMPIARAPIDLTHVVEAAETVRPAADAHGLQFHVDCDPAE